MMILNKPDNWILLRGPAATEGDKEQLTHPFLRGHLIQEPPGTLKEAGLVPSASSCQRKKGQQDTGRQA